MLRLEVGDDLLAFLAAQRARAREVLLRVAQQREQRGAPRDRIGLQHRELFGRGVAVDLGIDVHVELPGRERRRRRRSCHRSPLDTTEDATCVLEECGPEGPSGPGGALGRTENWKPGPSVSDAERPFAKHSTRNRRLPPATPASGALLRRTGFSPAPGTFTSRELRQVAARLSGKPLPTWENADLVAGRQGGPAMQTATDPSIRLALIDTQTIFREGLRALIEQEPDLEVVAHVAALRDLDELVVEPHVVVTDLVLADAEREQVIDAVHTRFPGAAIIALTTLDDLPTVQQVLAAGADGYVLKSANRADLFSGIRTVARGALYLQPSIGVAFASRPPEDASRSTVGGLTPKETEVLRLLALGHTNAEIAQIVGASLRTVETHRAHIHQKLDRHTRAELVRFALDAGLLRLDDQGTPTPDRRAINGVHDVVST